MNIEFDEDAHKFFVDFPDWKTTMNFGDKFAFLVNSELNGLQMAALSRVAEGGGLFGNNITSAAIFFDASATAFVSAKEMPVPTPQALEAAFDFGFVQGIKQSDLHLDYWGLSKSDGVVSVHTSLSNREEVDTAETVKPFTKVAANRCKVTTTQSNRPGFHAFRLHAKHSDHPQFIVNRLQNAQGPHDLLSHKMFLRRADCQLDFSTIFCFRDKKSGKFDGISAAEWRIRWKHVATYQEKRATDGSLEYVPTVSGPDRSDLMPSAGNPAAVGARERNILAIAQAGGPFLTPDALNARMRSASGVTKTFAESNADFDPSFVKRV